MYYCVNTYYNVIYAYKYMQFIIIRIQYSPLNSNSQGSTKFFRIMKCSNYEFALNIKCKYSRLSRDHNHLSELTEFLN